MNLADLREAIRVKTGYPERGETGTRRINNVLNQSLRKLWGEIPEVLLREEQRFEFEPQRSFRVVINESAGLERRVLNVHTADAPFTSQEVTDKILSARWIEWSHNGRWYHRRIAEVVYRAGDEPDKIVVTEPISNEIVASSPTYMDAYIYTYEYPYDADIQSVKRIVKNPETSPREVPLSVFGGEMDRIRIGAGWQSTGNIQHYQRGDFYQLEAPHYAPSVGQEERQVGSSTYRWGFNTLGSEQTSYGPSGAFSYKVCHVWGRWPGSMGKIKYGAVSTGHPFYISSPSKATDKIATIWGAPSIKITTPDIDYVFGYGMDTSTDAYQRSGIEKWIFRARHSTEDAVAAGTGLSGSAHGVNVENDGIYYLWDIIDADTTVVRDNGDADPVARRYPLKDFMGHYHMRFDRRPTDKGQVLMSCIRRPPTMDYDTDSPRIPPECYNCILELACSFLVGDRDGDMKRKSSYYQTYLFELDKLKRMYSFSGHERPSFGNGLNTSGGGRSADYPVTETS
jgi:hypothetical protein